jgi:hypothetical protein
MNLEDYKRSVINVCGDCHCTYNSRKCLTCQVTNLVDQCWNSARRSEARAKAKRDSRKVPITDWTFDKDDLARYVIGVHGSLTEDEACVFVLSELEDMSTWAVGKGELKVDWGATAKNWLRKSLKDSASRQSGGRLTLPSKTSQAADEHSETFREAMRLNSPKEPLSPLPISSGSGSRKTPRELPSSSRTQGKFL